MTTIQEKPVATQNTAYAYLVGRIRMLERGVLNGRILESALKVEDVEQVVRIISELPYLSEALQNIPKAPAPLDDALMSHFWETLKEVGRQKLGKNLSLFFQYSFDFNDIKLIIKRHLAKKASGREYPGTFDWKKVSHFVSGETGEHLSDVYRRAIEETLAVYESTHHVQIVELVLDRVYLQEVMNMAEISESPVIKNWLIAFFMFTFFRSAFRAKYQESKFELYRAIYFKNPYLSLEDLSDIITGPDEKIGEVLVHSGMKNILLGEGEYRNDPYYLAEIEKNMDNYLMRFIRPYRTLTFGPEPVFGFLYAKSIDIKNLRILLHGKYFGIGENELRNKLRECYYE